MWSIGWWIKWIPLYAPCGSSHPLQSPPASTTINPGVHVLGSTTHSAVLWTSSFLCFIFYPARSPRPAVIQLWGLSARTPWKYAVDVTSCRYQTKVLNWSPPVSPATRLCCTCCHGNTPGHICGTSPCPDVTLPLWKECPAPTFCHILLCGPNMLTPCDSQGIVLTAFSLHCQVQVHSGIQLL